MTDVGGDVLYLLRQVRDKGLRLTAIWLIHSHLDHAGGVVKLLKICGVPVLGPHKDDESLFQTLLQTTARHGFPVSSSFTLTHQLEEGEMLKAGNHSFQVLRIPGHTPGQAVLYNAENRLLVAGDVLFYETVGRTDSPRGNHDDLIDDICAKLLTLSENTQAIAGHGRVTSIRHEKRYNPLLVH